MALLAAVVLVPALVAVPSASAAVPRTPAFGAAIEGFARYEPATTCLPRVSQPGVAKLQALLKATYGKTAFESWRACSGSAASEHNEGRALDFMLNAGKASDVAIANAFVAWLFATDKYGNAYANARRLGIMYLIWHGRMWRAYDVSKGWQPYTGSARHDDHIHISFSWAGALGQTSFWTGQVADVALVATPPGAIPPPAPANSGSGTLALGPVGPASPASPPASPSNPTPAPGSAGSAPSSTSPTTAPPPSSQPPTSQPPQSPPPGSTTTTTAPPPPGPTPPTVPITIPVP